MIKAIKKIALIGTFVLAGGVYTESSFNNSPSKEKDTSYEKLNNFLEKQNNIYNKLYEASELEKKLKEEKEKFSKPFYLSPDLLNTYIKDAYSNVKKWPNEIDKRLFRLMLKQESNYDAHAVSPTGYRGLGQIGTGVVETFRPDEFEAIKDSTTGQIDTLKLERMLFNPITNLELSLETLDYASNFCKTYNPNWKTLNLEDKRKTILACYSAGCTKVKEGAKWDLKSEELKEENREYPEKIMEAYHNPNIKVKL